MRKINNCWYDQHGNSWPASKYKRKEAQQLSITLVNCSHCFDCRECTNCVSCTGCSNCLDCMGCIECTSCEGCTSCSACDSSRDCTHCTRADRTETACFCSDVESSFATLFSDNIDRSLGISHSSDISNAHKVDYARDIIFIGDKPETILASVNLHADMDRGHISSVMFTSTGKVLVRSKQADDSVSVVPVKEFLEKLSTITTKDRYIAERNYVITTIRIADAVSQMCRTAPREEKQ